MPTHVEERDDLNSGIEAEPRLDDPRPHYVVAWIRWDSGFRGTGLRIGDHIIAVGDAPIVRPKTTEEAQKTSYKAIGQYGETQRWHELGLKDGSPLELTVERRSATGAGWERMKLTGKVLNKRQYYDTSEGSWRETLGPDGPRHNDYGDFPEHQWWSTWYQDQLIKQLSKSFQVWSSNSFNSRSELKALLEFQARVNHLVEHFPGPFATALRSDFQSAVELLTGKAYPLTEEDLRYRKAEDEKVQRISDLAQAAWAAFQKEHAAELLPELPTLHPVRDDRGPITGKLVLLPTVGNRDWFGEIDHYFLGANSGRNWFFVDVYEAAATRMREAARRYTRLVYPNLQENFTIIGRILPDPRMVFFRGSTMFGFQVEPVAALAGGAMFVDLTRQQDGLSLFEGEPELMRPAAPSVGLDAPPQEVMRAFIEALKDGDEATWRSYYADWSAYVMDDGRARISPYSPRSRTLTWEDARRRILKDVYGAAVSWVGEPRELTTGKEFPGSPRLQEVDVWVDHIGQFDGEYRAFTSPFLRRLWQLQKLDDGPWRISTDYGI